MRRRRSHATVIYLDMDGVCVDFIRGACRALGRHDLEDWPMGRADLYAQFGMDGEVFWDTIEGRAPRFWLDLEPYPWFLNLHRALKRIAPVYFLSAPSRRPDSASAKVSWLQARFGPSFQDYILTGRKHLLAGPGRVLIDDLPEKIARFRRAGGMGVLFPQPWNGSPVPSDPVAHVVGEVRALLEPRPHLWAKE